MRTVMVRYKVKADRAEENVRYIAAVFAELERTGTPGIRYASFRQPDGVSFVHLAAMDAADANPLTALGSFKEFTANIRERCEEPPVTVELTPVGVYRMFA